MAPPYGLAEIERLGEADRAEFAGDLLNYHSRSLRPV